MSKSIPKKRQFKEAYANEDSPKMPYVGRPYTCNMCGKSYMWKVSLGRHLREECGKTPQHTCALCGREFKQRMPRIEVQKMKTIRPSHLWRPFPCNTCGKSYTRKDTLRRHLRYECGKNPQYICYVCKKGFKQKSNFHRHNLNVHGLRL
ncbi:Similar to ZNF623: Zinc finger protein 623 (Homo sapiens) [Cotesia congregata]|uniref:Similar to ZNF623: Zinc finger protein 623 (Homo sapiens) n=1 Tax=Cotesia congregata TaxID=51543 RepID=A0A8J2HF46_COTCN|nr:Similar to ZNF623: Zinc finger protein 623 (Homo sapiens) [Cotesia congregata]